MGIVLAVARVTPKRDFVTKIATPHQTFFPTTAFSGILYVWGTCCKNGMILPKGKHRSAWWRERVLAVTLNSDPAAKTTPPENKYVFNE